MALRALCRAMVRAIGFALLFASCATPATEVIVSVDTDAPTRLLTLRAFVSRGGDASAEPTEQFWDRTTDARAFSIPASFGVVPGNTPNDGVVLVVVEAGFSPTIAGQPALMIQRAARFRFVPHVSSIVRLFLPTSCAGSVAAPARCRDTTSPCTISRFCREQSPPQTCGDEGTCTQIDVVPTPLTNDAGARADTATDRSMVDTAMDTARIDACVRQCAGRTCGSDGCGGSCGACPGTMVCTGAGVCAASCTPMCTGRTCGSDGCAGTCGTCMGGQVCNGSGQCVVMCMRNCTGRVCGPDGCGGTCGSCGAPQVCDASGACVSGCMPSCTGRVCGTDGCSGSCGTCVAGLSCNASGQCICVPNCTGRVCGNDSCGGSCGTCPGVQSCSAAGQCVCTPMSGCTASMPRTVCTVAVGIAPHFAGALPGGWTSRSDTAPSERITLTFSPAISGFSLTVVDPNAMGNLMIAYNAGGAPIGGYTFMYNAGASIMDTGTISAAGITRVILQPGAGDYVEYRDLVFNGCF